MKDNDRSLEDLARDHHSFLPPRLNEYAEVTSFPSITNGIYQAEPAVFYRRGELLTTEPDAVTRASSRVGLAVDLDHEEIEGLPNVSRLRVRGDLDPARITKVLTRELPDGVVVAPNHVLVPAQIHGLGPGTDPLPCREMTETKPMGDCGGIGVAVIDTGMFDHYPSLSGTDLDQLVSSHSTVGANDEEKVDVDGDGIVDRRVAAHGGFIGGVIQTHLPQTPMSLQRAVGPDGLIDEVTVSVATLEALKDKEIGVINLSLGSYVHAYSDLVSLRAALDSILDARPDLLLVCAAGNDRSEDRWYPAAWAAHRKYAEAVVSVGALDTKGSRPRMASFSNRGSWVTAWSPGVDIASIYPTGVEYQYHGPAGPVGTLGFEGLARWSGTSFAAPHAAAAILAHGAARGMSPREAWADLRSDAGFVLLSGPGS